MRGNRKDLRNMKDFLVDRIVLQPCIGTFRGVIYLPCNQCGIGWCLRIRNWWHCNCWLWSPFLFFFIAPVSKVYDVFSNKVCSFATLKFLSAKQHIYEGRIIQWRPVYTRKKYWYFNKILNSIYMYSYIILSKIKLYCTFLYF